MVGLALEGGGAKGAFHMGAVKALLEEGYNFQGVTGTSIGALNGAIIAQGDFELGYHMWETIDNSLLFETEDSALAILTSKAKQILENRGIDTSKIRALLDSIINEKKLRESGTDFGMVTVSLTDLKPLELYKEDIPYGKLVDYLMASANYPAFKIEPLDGKLYIDGGFHDNLPINLLIHKGYREIVAIHTLAIGRVRKIEDESVNIINITPSENLGRILNFDNNLIQKNLIRGYFDAMRAIKNLKGKKYYIEPVNDELILSTLLSISEATIEIIGKKMDISPMDPKRMLFEKIIPDLSNMLGLKGSSSYQDVIIGILENLAEEKDLDKHKIRKFSDFLEELKSTDGVKNNSSPILHHILRKTKLASVLSKEPILKDVAQELLMVLNPKNFE